MRKVTIYRNGILAGTLTEVSRNHFVFTYNDDYYNDNKQPPISLTLPKNRKEYKSDSLFPFFFNMLSEGVNRKLQCKNLRIDENDSFGLLMSTAQFDTVGAVTVERIENAFS